MNNKLVSIIIVNYNVKDLLQSCLNSINKFYSNDSFEIIIVDNNSNDGSIEIIKKNFPSCILLSNTTNAGFSEANNQGVKIAKGEYILLLNPDTEFKNDSLNSMIKYLETNPTISIIAPKLLNADGSLQISCWKFPSVLNIIAETFFLHLIFKIGQYSEQMFDSLFEIDVASGACLLFRKELTNQIGLLDSNLFWMEDVDYCYRAKSIGKVVYFPETEIIHHSGKSLRQNYNIAISNQIISKLKYLKKHFNSFYFFIGILFSIIHVITRIIVFGILSPFKNEYLLKLNAYICTMKKLLEYILFNNQKVA